MYAGMHAGMHACMDYEESFYVGFCEKEKCRELKQ